MFREALFQAAQGALLLCGRMGGGGRVATFSGCPPAPAAPDAVLYSCQAGQAPDGAGDAVAQPQAGRHARPPQFRPQQTCGCAYCARNSGEFPGFMRRT